MGVVFTENDKAVIVEAPLDDANTSIESADGVSKGSGKVTIYVFHPRFPMSIHITSDTIPFQRSQGEVTDKTPILKVSEVVSKKSLVGSRTQRIRDAMAANHKDTCDVFQAAVSGATDGDGGLVLQNLVNKGIHTFPTNKLSQLLDIYTVLRMNMFSTRFNTVLHTLFAVCVHMSSDHGTLSLYAMV